LCTLHPFPTRRSSDLDKRHDPSTRRLAALIRKSGCVRMRRSEVIFFILRHWSRFSFSGCTLGFPLLDAQHTKFVLFSGGEMAASDRKSTRLNSSHVSI